MTIIMLIGYLIIAAVILNDVKRVVRRCRVECRMSHGKRVIYLRERRTGRLIGARIACSEHKRGYAASYTDKGAAHA